MIRDFKLQTGKTIGNFLECMGKRPRVYSKNALEFGADFKEMVLFVYAHRKEVVLVCMDPYESDTEIQRELPDNGQPPIYYSMEGDRVSTVWKLKMAMESFRRALELAGVPVPELWGVWVTTSELHTVRGIENVWEHLGVSAIQVEREVMSREFPLNGNKMLCGASFMKTYWEMVNVKKMVDRQAVQETLIEEFREANAFYSLGDPFDDSDDEEEDDESEDEEVTDEEGLAVDDLAEQSSGDDDNDEFAQKLSDFLEEEMRTGQTEPMVGGPASEPFRLKAEVLPPMKNAREEMEKLVGCEEIKAHIEELKMLYEYNDLLHYYYPEYKQHEVALHSIFFGRPGTGKTTVCRLMGALLHEAGALSKGHVVICNRGTFVGQHWGYEEKAVNMAIEKAKGGVLMIDEAYLLNSAHESDPGKMVVPLLMELLADEHRRDIAVVLCGYKRPMMKLLELNPGLESRFPNRFEFADFSVDELLEITKRRVKEHGYHFTPLAWEKYKTVLGQAYNVRDPEIWGNARFVTNLLNRIYAVHARRCVLHEQYNPKELLKLMPSDILPIEVPKSKPHIGF